MDDKGDSFFLATGRRKEARARVKFIPKGKGRIIINGRDIASYFATADYQMQAKKPLLLTSMASDVDVKARVNGGGPSGQAGAISLGISRALLKFNPQLHSVLRKENLLTRDPRTKERKKYGRKGARRRFQWTKR